LSDLYQSRVQRFLASENLPLLTHIQRGIEKEGLRVTSQATVAQTRHPQTLGSALTHGSITTDYSEALLEFITPVSQQVNDSIDYLTDLHKFTLSQLEGEYLWPASMPCQLAGDESIPIAQYGSSNIAQMKNVYRQGLGHRYGRTMQSIAGIHYNFSMPDDFWPYYQQLCGDKGDVQAFKSQRYFDLIRNFRRHSWLLIYLFGASPALDSSFVGDKKPEQLSEFGQHTLGLPFATSLRMSDLGYQSKAQSELNISYNNLHSYLEGLEQAMERHYPAYGDIGIKVDDTYRQLNANILQIENEYYSEIRPKRITLAEEKPVIALSKRGVEYVEVRILDSNPLLPVGIDEQQMHFLDTFLLYCLLSDSPELSAVEQEEIKFNQQQVILQGRRPSLMLKKNGEPIGFDVSANELLAEMKVVSNLLDSSHGNDLHSKALTAQVNKVANSELTPSAVIMRAIENGSEFTDLMLAQAKKHQAYFSKTSLSATKVAQLQLAAKESLRLQKQLEASNESSFEHFMQRDNA